MTDPDSEPEPICGNCDCYVTDKFGKRQCANRLSIWFRFNPTSANRCERFFPDPKRWPDADHG